jgi:hypothetical protein
MGGKTMAQKLLSASSSPKIWREWAMTGKNDIYTFADCPDRYVTPFGSEICRIDSEDDYFYLLIPCKKVCEDDMCPRGYRR